MRPDQQVNLSIGLALPDQKELEDFVKQVSDPAGPQYKHYLTPDQFAARFSPSEKNYQKLIDYVEANGLKVVQTHSDRILLGVKGSVGDIQKLFKINLHRYQRADKGEFYAPDTEPQVDIDVPIGHITGLDNVHVPGHSFHRHDKPKKKLDKSSFSTAKNQQNNSKVTNVGSESYYGYFVGNDFRAAYLPTCSSLTGTNQSIALVEFEGFYQSDITAYENYPSSVGQTNLPNVPVTPVLIDGYSGIPDMNPPSEPGGFLGECTLDIDMAIAMAPGISNVYVYEGPNNSMDSFPMNQIAYDQVADDVLSAIATPPKGVALSNQVSCSWFGFGDANTNIILMKMAAQGQSFFMASGDKGSYVHGYFPYDPPYPYPPMPYNDPSGEINWMTVVGGTQLYTSGPQGNWTGESTWNDPYDGASGGGICNNVTIPYYQVQGNYLNWPSNGGSAVNRNIPDVAIDADWIYIIVNGQSWYGSGTSAAAPLWAAYMALVNQNLQTTGVGPMGFLNPTLYSMGNSTIYPGLFHDINDGSNNYYEYWYYFWLGYPGVVPGPFTAITGYDLATGWGSPMCAFFNGTINYAPTFTPTPCGPNTTADLSWSTKPALPGSSSMSNYGAGILNNQLYIVGGNSGPSFLNTTLAYNGTWNYMATMSANRGGLGVGVVNGKLFAVGGFNGTSYLSSMECYDPSTNTWSANNPWSGTPLPSMSTPRAYFTLAVVNGILYAIGGTNNGTSYLSSVEAFNPASNMWVTKSGVMPTARQGLSSGVVNGKIYAIDGYNGSNLSTVESYDPVADSWTSGLAACPFSGSGIGIGVLNQTLYAMKLSAATALSVRAYDPVSNTWIAQAGYSPVLGSSTYYVASGVLSGTLYAIGSNTNLFAPPSDPKNLSYGAIPVCATFTPTPVVPTPTTPPSCVSIKTTQTGGGGGFGNSSGTIAVDNARGVYYVADRAKNRVEVYNLNGGWVGNIGGTSPTWGTSTMFNDPYALAIDANGCLYVGQYNGWNVLKVEPTTGSVLALFGGGVNPVRAVWIDPNGDVYVGYQGGKVYVYATATYNNSYASLTPGGLSDSTNLNVTPSGLVKVGNTLYVSDGASKVLKYWITPGTTYSWSYLGLATNVPLAPFQMALDTLGDFYITSRNNGMFYVYAPNFAPLYHCQPSPSLNYTGIGVDNKGYVYVAGTTGPTTKVYQMVLCSAVVLPTPTPSPNCCQVVATPTGTAGGFGTTTGQLAVDPTRNLYYVADQNNNRIQVFQTNGGAIGTIGGSSPTWGYTGEFNSPSALAVDPQGYLYVGEYGGADIKKIEPTTGALLATFGAGVVGNVRGLFVDTNGDVYACSQGGHVLIYSAAGYTNNYVQVGSTLTDITNMGSTPSGLVKVTNSAGVSFLLVSTGAGNGAKEVMEYQMGPNHTFPYGPTLVTSLPYAYQLAKDTVGNIYVSSYNDARFLVYNQNLELIYACQQSVANDVGIGVDNQGNVYLSGPGGGQGRVVQETVCSLINQPTPTPFPNCCTVLNTTTGLPGTPFTAMSGIAVDNGRSNLYVVDAGNNQIDVFGPLGSLYPVVSFGGSSMFNSPQGLCMGLDGYLYVTEPGSGDVKKVALPTTSCPYPSCPSVVGTFGSGVIGYVRSVFVDVNGDIYFVSQNGYLFIYSQSSSSWVGPGGSSGYVLPGAGSTPSGILKVTNGSGNNYLLVSDGVSKVLEYPLTGYSVGTGTVITSLPLGPYQLALSPSGALGAGDIYMTSFTDGQFYVYSPNLEMIYKCQPTTGGNYLNAFCIATDYGGNVYLGGTIGGANPQVWQIQPCDRFMPTLAAPTGKASESLKGAFKSVFANSERGGAGTPTVSPTPTPDGRRDQLVVAQPNVSRSGETIKFVIHLDAPAKLDLSLFSLSGDKIFEKVMEGNAGVNTLNWGLENQNGSKVASGLYIYWLTADDETGTKTQKGKVAVLH